MVLIVVDTCSRASERDESRLANCEPRTSNSQGGTGGQSTAQNQIRRSSELKRTARHLPQTKFQGSVFELRQYFRASRQTPGHLIHIRGAVGKRNPTRNPRPEHSTN